MEMTAKQAREARREENRRALLQGNRHHGAQCSRAAGKCRAVLLPRRVSVAAFNSSRVLIIAGIL